MNLSGQAVRALIDWYKIDDLKKLLVIHDDVALPLGKMKWVANGGAGGQHGIESIIEHLGGNKEFTRLKFGIGPDPGGDRRSNYVLSKFPAEHNDLLEKSIKASVDGVMLFLQNASLNKIMDTYNGMDLNPNTQKNTQPKELSQKAGSQEFPTKEKIEKSSNAQP
jgi:PTH1 family peptidyl-tRNA hydrolase